VGPDNTITYTPEPSYFGQDTFLYSIIDADGDTAMATVSVDINCLNCQQNTKLLLSWEPNPDDISGYIVSFGPTAETATTNLSYLPLSDGIINPLAPSAEYDMRYDLGLLPSDNVCFRRRADNRMDKSDMAEAVCSVI